LKVKDIDDRIGEMDIGEALALDPEQVASISILRGCYAVARLLHGVIESKGQ